MMTSRPPVSPLGWRTLGFALLTVLLPSCQNAPTTDPDHPPSAPFSFALIGDQEYDVGQEALFPRLRDAINADRSLAFVIHDGDIKSGVAPCRDELFQHRLEQFQTFAAPFILLFGDNEWVDCHRHEAGGFDPIERLSRLRSLFSPSVAAPSLGRRKLSVERHSPEYPEIVRWRRGKVMFVGLNIPGSNNGLKTAPHLQAAARAEFAGRDAANRRWLTESFGLARREGCVGLLIAMQANPWDHLPTDELTGYQAVLQLLEAETRAFGRPVVLVHGDSHYFRIDKPLPAPAFDPKEKFQPMLWDSHLPRLENFTRVETFGTVDLHWIKATVDPTDPNLFRFEPRYVASSQPKPKAP